MLAKSSHAENQTAKETDKAKTTGTHRDDRPDCHELARRDHVGSRGNGSGFVEEGASAYRSTVVESLGHHDDDVREGHEGC